LVCLCRLTEKEVH
jgi:hypothetical protein